MAVGVLVVIERFFSVCVCLRKPARREAVSLRMASETGYVFMDMLSGSEPCSEILLFSSSISIRSYHWR